MKAYKNEEVIDKLYNNFNVDPDPFSSASFDIFDDTETLYKQHDHKYVIKFTSVNNFAH